MAPKILIHNYKLYNFFKNKPLINPPYHIIASSFGLVSILCFRQNILKQGYEIQDRNLAKITTSRRGIKNPQMIITSKDIIDIPLKN